MEPSQSSFLWDLLNHFPYLGLFLLLVLGGIGFPIPEDFILIICGVTIASGVVEPLPALLVVYVGMLITDFGLHYVGRKYGRKILTHKRFHKFISPRKLERIEEKFHRWGILFILVGRHLVVLRAQVFLVSGVLRMPIWKFIIADSIAAILTMGLMVGAGYAGGHYLSRVEHDVKIFKYVAAALAAALILGFIAFKWWSSRKRGVGTAEPDPPAGEPPAR